MNNEAFRDLLRGKSTKEIARKAVEDEFRRKEKRKRRGDDYSSDDDSTNGKRQYKKKSKGKKFEGEDIIEKETFQFSMQYRDRAKERREGNKDLLESEDKGPIPMKYPLSVNKAKENLRKHVDVEVARKIKQEKSKNSILDPSRGTYRKKRTDAVEKKKDLGTTFTSVSDARKWIETYSLNDVESSLGKSILSFLQEYFLSPLVKEIRVTPVGLSIQRSTTTFSICPDLSDRKYVWMVPLEQASMLNEKEGKNEGTFMDLDSNILSQIVKSFEKKNGSNHVVSKEERVKNSIINSSNRNEGSDSDDIFDDIGDYVPTVLKKDSSTSRSSHNEASHFEGLVTSSQLDEGGQSEGYKVNKVKKIVQRIKSREKPRGDFGVFGVEYGEDDMDVDFSGQIAVEGETKKNLARDDKTTSGGSYSDAS